MKTILVPVGGSDADVTTFETALALAQPLAPHLEFVHARVTAAEAALHTPHMEFARGAGLHSALDMLRSNSERRSVTAKHNVRDFCTRRNIEMVEASRPAASVTARWREDEGEVMARLLFHARHNDLVVMTRATKLDGLPPDRLETLLMGCGRPLVIASAEAPMRTLGTAMVCWKETAGAARAVSASMPLLLKAGRVIVVSVKEDGEAPPDVLADLIGQLGWHGIAADAHLLERGDHSTADALFAAARSHGADLMVMAPMGTAACARSVRRLHAKRDRSGTMPCLPGALSRRNHGGAKTPIDADQPGIGGR